MRKTLLFTAYLLTLTCAIEAQQLKAPAPSSTQTIKQDFGLGTIELSYSRPNIKGRKVFGDLVPFGKVWRTGANQATTLTFDDEVTIGGTKIPAGKYGLLTMPDKTAWTIIITKQLDVTSPAAYKQESDVVRVQAKPQALKSQVESFTMQFANVKSTSIELHMMWDLTDITLPITTEIETRVMAQITELMNKEDKKEHPYYLAAMYYMDNGKDLKQALDWFNKSAEQNPKAFWVFYQRANCLAKLGKKQDAIESANKSIELAKEAKNDDYVAMNQKLLTRLK